jgi:hypothetical protein
MPPSSSGPGRHPFKVEITGSNPVGGTRSGRGILPIGRVPRSAFLQAGWNCWKTDISSVSPGVVRGDIDSLYLTVGPKSAGVGYKSSQGALIAGGKSSDAIPNIKLSGPIDDEGMIQAEPQREGDEAAGEQPMPSAAASAIAVSICWTLGSDRDGNVPPLRDAFIELWDADAGPHDLLYVGHTNYYSGCKTA